MNEICGASNASIGSDASNVSDASDSRDVSVASGNWFTCLLVYVSASLLAY